MKRSGRFALSPTAFILMGSVGFFGKGEVIKCAIQSASGMARRVREGLEKRVPIHARPKEIATMKSSTKDQIAGKIHELKGKVKESIGKATDNPKLESEGSSEKISGSIQKGIGKVEKILGK